MSQLQIWIQAIRPKTLAASLVPILVAVFMARGFWGLFSSTFLAILFCALLIQITCNLVNDLFDYRLGADNNKRLGPQRVTQAGLVSSEQIEKAIVVCTSLAAAIGLYPVSYTHLTLPTICSV